MRGDKKQRDGHQTGFTILELLVVISIIVLLMGMGVGGYDRMKRQAKSLQCVTKMRQLGASLNLYLGDHNLMMPILAPGRDDRSLLNSDTLSSSRRARL